MARLGRSLTPTRFFVDENPGAINIQTTPTLVCQTVPYPAGGPNLAGAQTAVLHGLVWGLVDAPVVWNADIWYSTNAGATWNYITNYIPFNAAVAAGGTQGATFAYLDLVPGQTYVFAILVRKSVDGPRGTGNFTDLACHLMVEFGNRNETSFTDAAAKRPLSGTLGANR